MRSVRAVIKAVIVYSALGASTSGAFAQLSHEGLRDFRCARVEAIGLDDAGPTFRESVRSTLPRLSVDPECPNLLLFNVYSIKTDSGSAAAFSFGLEVYRDVLLPGQQGATVIRAMVWRDDHLYATSGRPDAAKVRAEMKRMKDSLMTNLRDTYLLAGNE